MPSSAVAASVIVIVIVNLFYQNRAGLKGRAQASRSKRLENISRLLPSLFSLLGLFLLR